MVCPNCDHTTNSTMARFCEKCGIGLSNDLLPPLKKNKNKDGYVLFVIILLILSDNLFGRGGMFSAYYGFYELMGLLQMLTMVLYSAIPFVMLYLISNKRIIAVALVFALLNFGLNVYFSYFHFW